MNEYLNIDINELPKKRRLVIQYALDHPSRVVLMNMEEFAQFLQVDPTTIVKACKAVGLSGYHDLKNKLKEQIRKTQMNAVFGGIIKDIESDIQPKKIAQESISGDIMMLQRLYESLDVEVIEKTANLILSAKATYIIGLGHLGIIAKYMERIFRSVIPNVRANTEYHGELFTNMAHISKSDVVIGISIDRCQNQTYDTLKYVQEEIKASTICITDSPYSPLVSVSQYALLINNTHSMYFGTMIGAFSIANALFNTIATMKKSTAKDHFKFFRDMSFKNNTYI